MRLREWGLVGVVLSERTPRVSLYGGGAARSAPAAPGNGPGGGTELGKPVIYVTLVDGTEASFDLSVTAPGGRILEHWPPGVVARERTGERVTWSIQARSAACMSSTFPALGSAECVASRDGYCELPQLAEYAAAGAACVRVGETASPFVFYRSDIARSSLPLVVRKERDGTLALSLLPSVRTVGVVARVSRHPSAAGTRVRIVPGPMSGQPITLPPPAEGGANGDVGVTWIGDQLRSHGMSDSEIDAFMRAWRIELFGDPSVEHDDQAPAPPADAPSGLRPAADALLYWLPAQTVSELAPLVVTPQAQDIRRSLLVRVNLD